MMLIQHCSIYFVVSVRKNTTVLVATNPMMHVHTFVQSHSNIEGYVKAYEN